MANRKNGFTLIELLVVVSIVGMLSSVVLSSLNTAREKANDTQRVASLRNVAAALELYRSDHRQYPSTGGLGQGNATSVYTPQDCALTVGLQTDDWIPGLVSGGYISELPTDPSPRENICFMYSSDGNNYVLSLWDAVADLPQRHTPESNPLYSLAGFREYVMGQWCLYNHTNLNGGAYSGYNFYADSFTITTLPDDANSNCTPP